MLGGEKVVTFVQKREGRKKHGLKFHWGVSEERGGNRTGEGIGRILSQRATQAGRKEKGEGRGFDWFLIHSYQKN